MRGYFQGAVIYNNKEIQQALKGFSSQKEKAESLFLGKVKIAEDTYSPSWLRKCISGETLHTRWNNLSNTDKRCFPYTRWVVQEGYVALSEEDYELLSNLNVIPNPWSGGDEDTYIQLYNLSSAGKSCYLNPEQSAFILRYGGVDGNV